MALDTVTALRRGRENCMRLYLLVQEQIATPTQSNVDAIVAAATSNTLTPKPSYGIDGLSVQWESYAESLLRQIDQIDKLIIRAGGPFEVRSRAYS